MERIFLVGGDPSTADALESLAERVFRLDGADGVQGNGNADALVVLGGGVVDPIETTRALQKSWPDLPVVVTCGSDRYDDVAGSLRVLPGDVRVVSLDDRDALLETVRETLGRLRRRGAGGTTPTDDPPVRRLRFLAESSSLLASSLDHREILERLGRLIVPELADWAGIDLLESDGSLRRIVTVHRDPSKEWLVRALSRYTPSAGGPVAEVLASGRSRLVPELAPEVVERTAEDEEHLRLIRELDPRSTILVPLVARGRTIGSMLLVRTSDGPAYTRNDLELAEDLARRGALAVDNSLLFRQIQEQEQRYRGLVDDVDAIVWETDARTFRPTFISERAETILGYPIAAWLDDPAISIEAVHPDDREMLVARLRDAVVREDNLELEYRMIAAGGDVRWVRSLVHVFRDPDGQARLLRGLTVDITNRVRAEKLKTAQLEVVSALAGSESLRDVPEKILAAVIENLDWAVGALWEVHEADDRLDCVAFAHLPGIEVPEFEAISRSTRFTRGVGLPGRVWELRRPAWIADVTSDGNFPRAPVAQREGLHGAFGFPIISGRKVLGVVEFFAPEVREPDASLLAFMEAVGAQIGQFFSRKRIEEALLDSEALLRSTLESSLDAIVAMGRDGRLVEFNPAAEALLGHRREEVVGKQLSDLLVPERLRERHRAGLARFLETGESRLIGRRVEMPALRADGTEIPVELSITAGPETRTFTGTIRDLSARARAEARRDALHAVTRVLAEGHSIRDAGSKLVDALCRAFRLPYGEMWVVDRAYSVLRCVEIWKAPDVECAELEQLTRSVEFRRGEGFAGGIWESGEPGWVEITPRPSHPRAALALEAGFHTAFGFPIVSDGGVLGVMHFMTRERAEPDRELLQLMHSIGSQIGQFIERREAEEEVGFQKALLESQAEATIDGLLVVGADGRMLSWNRRFVEMWDIPSEVMESRSDEQALVFVLQRLERPDEFLPRVRYLYEHPEEESRDEVQLKDGRTIDRFSAPLRAEDGTSYGRAWYFRDITDRKRGEIALAESSERFAFLAEAGNLFVTSLDPLAVLENLAELAVPFLADWCAVDILDEVGTLRRITVKHRDPALREHAKTAVERAVYPFDPADPRGVAAVVRTRRSEVASDVTEELLAAAAGGDGELLEAIRSLGMASYMCVPLLAHGRVLGAITLASGRSGRRYSPADLALAEDLTRRAAAAIENARLYSERSYVARTLQESLLPPHLPQIRGVDLAASFHPAGEGADVGGDFYDLYETGTDDWAVVIGDVCGKGADAAALTALARYTIRAATIQARKPSKVLTTLNEAILMQRSDERFATVAFGRLRRTERGSYRFTLASGGHPLPFVLRADGTVQRAGRPGTLLGLFPDVTLRDQVTVLAPGDAVILYTDGVTEARSNGDILGENGLRDILLGCAGLDSTTIARRIERAALDLQSGRARDDIAVIVLRVLPQAV